jgi:hypothetical protein
MEILDSGCGGSFLQQGTEDFGVPDISPELHPVLPQLPRHLDPISLAADELEKVSGCLIAGLTVIET